MEPNFDFGLEWDFFDLDEAIIQTMEDPLHSVVPNMEDQVQSSSKFYHKDPIQSVVPNMEDPVQPQAQNMQDQEDIDLCISSFLSENTSKSTNYKNRCAEKRFDVFLESLHPGDNRKIDEIPEDELDQIICQFFISAKKVDEKSTSVLGELYQPDSLSSFQHAWQRVLVERGSKLNIKKDTKFTRSRNVLASRRKQLTSMGLGNKPCATRPLSGTEVDALYLAGYFGTDCPLTLQRNMWWKITTTFGYRARDEARKLKFGDIKLFYDENNNKYLEWQMGQGTWQQNKDWREKPLPSKKLQSQSLFHRRCQMPGPYI